MQAVILAGGKGRRLRPITEQIPKPMIEIKGKPFLQYQLEFIKDCITKNILLLVGYLGDKIEGYFKNGAALGLNIQYSYEKAPLGTAGALRNANDKLEDEFLLLYGDSYLPIDYKELVGCFHKSGGKAMMVIYDNSQNIACNNVNIAESGLVSEYNKKNPNAMSYVEAGVMVFKKEITELIPTGRLCSLEEEIFPKLISQKQMHCFLTKQRFYDIGTAAGLKIIKDIL